MRRLIVSAVCSALFCAPTAFAAQGSTGSSVPLTASPDGHDTVPVQVNGAGPYPFILDTGADGTAVYQWFADQAKLPKMTGKDQDLSGQTGSAKVSMYRIADLSLGGLHLHDAEAFGLPNRKDKGRSAGVLGNDFMDQAVVVFDFPCHQVDIHAKPADAKALAGSAPLVHADIDQGTTLLTFPVTVNGVKGVAILDSGSRQTRLTSSFASKAGIDVAGASFHDDEPIYGTSMNKLVPRTGPVSKVSFAGITVTGAQAQVVDLPVLTEDFHGEPAMLLGADLLSHYRLVYDHAAQNVAFAASRCTAH